MSMFHDGRMSRGLPFVKDDAIAVPVRKSRRAKSIVRRQEIRIRRGTSHRIRAPWNSEPARPLADSCAPPGRLIRRRDGKEISHERSPAHIRVAEIQSRAERSSLSRPSAHGRCRASLRQSRRRSASAAPVEASAAISPMELIGHARPAASGHGIRRAVLTHGRRASIIASRSLRCGEAATGSDLRLQSSGQFAAKQ